MDPFRGEAAGRYLYVGSCPSLLLLAPRLVCTLCTHNLVWNRVFSVLGRSHMIFPELKISSSSTVDKCLGLMVIGLEKFGRIVIFL